MRQGVEILGWTFRRVAFEETRLVELPCVYLMAHETAPGEHAIHYVGQTHDLRERFAGHHMLAAAQAGGATHVLAMAVSEGEAHRRRIETVLRWELRPPLNREEIPTHIQAWRAANDLGLADVAQRARQAHLSGAAPLLPAWSRFPITGR